MLDRAQDPPMRRLASSIPLTDSPPDEARKNTWAGQASWATGPEHCVDCKFFRRRVDRGSCVKARAMFHRERTPRFPIAALSCRYFVAKVKPKVRFMPDERLLDLKLTKYHETPSAYLFGPAPCERKDRQWVPKSLCEYNNDGTVTMPEWLAIEKGWENHVVDR